MSNVCIFFFFKWTSRLNLGHPLLGLRTHYSILTTICLLSCRHFSGDFKGLTDINATANKRKSNAIFLQTTFFFKAVTLTSALLTSVPR